MAALFVRLSLRDQDGQHCSESFHVAAEADQWAGTLAGVVVKFHLVLEYWVGSNNYAADALSCRANLANLELIAALSSSAFAISVKDQFLPTDGNLKPPQEEARADSQKKLEADIFYTFVERWPPSRSLRCLLKCLGPPSLYRFSHTTYGRLGIITLFSACNLYSQGDRAKGQERTYSLVQRAYYWPQMRDDIETYVKPDHQKKAGLLQPLPIPKRQWKSVSMDYISGLPKVGDLGSIIVVVDRLSKCATFIAAPKHVTAEGMAHLFFKLSSIV
ncbi:UNVERIFIED_CONTAM: Transposon Ty3-G Gag-Pol polyprotein [Sesamum indicum]